MGDLSPDFDVKLGRLLPMLSSPVPGEVVATAAAIGRTLNRAGMDWHDLAKRLIVPAQPHFQHAKTRPYRPQGGDDPLAAMAAWLDKYALHRLTENQCDFVQNVRRIMAMGRALSPAQIQYLRDLYHRHGGGHD